MILAKQDDVLLLDFGMVVFVCCFVNLFFKFSLFALKWLHSTIVSALFLVLSAF